MTAQHHGKLNSLLVLALLKDVRSLSSTQADRMAQVSRFASCVGKALSLEKCLVLLAEEEGNESVLTLSVRAEFSLASANSQSGKSYWLSKHSELYKMIKAGKPLPIKDVLGPSNIAGIREGSFDFSQFVQSTRDQNVVAFPLFDDGHVIGIWSMHKDIATGSFSDEIVELGEALTAEFANGLSKCGPSSTKTQISEYVVSATSIGPHIPEAETLSGLRRELVFERAARQIVCRLFSTLDRNAMLQTVVDSVGRALGARRCLIVKNEVASSPVVTHEYVEADISPLGLGRTGEFPLGAVQFFTQRAGAISDILAINPGGLLSLKEVESLSDYGVRSMAGAAIERHGVLVVVDDLTPRVWQNRELDLLEMVAKQVSVALGHCQSYQQVNDQFLNINLLSNLAQQLTNTLELANRQNKHGSGEEKEHRDSSLPPLSLRELEVLKLIASGLANKEIAQRLFLTESTVELHASRIRKKLKLKSRTALVKYACDNGLD